MCIFSVAIIIILATVGQPESNPARWNSTQTNDTDNVYKANIGHVLSRNDHGVDQSGKVKQRWWNTFSTRHLPTRDISDGRLVGVDAILEFVFLFPIP